MFAPRRRTEGQALVLVALAFVLLVAFLGLALDGANAFGQRRRVANAADATTLAAARKLIELKSSGGTGDEILDTINEFLINDNNIDVDHVVWEASYVSREEPDTVIGPVEDGVAPPSSADGVRLDLSVDFETYFMRIMGQTTLTVGTTSTSLYGPLGTGVGQDLIPLAISDAALAILLDKGEIRIDLRGKIMDAYDALPFGLQNPSDVDDVITDSRFAHVSFRDVAGAPVTGDDCASPTVAENLSYWWCNGSPNQLRINRELPSVANPSNWGILKASMITRITTEHRDTAVVPVYVPLPGPGGSIYFQLAYFVAVRMSFDHSEQSLHMELLHDYVSAGAMIGEGSGVETGVWAVNLKR